MLVPFALAALSYAGSVAMPRALGRSRLTQVRMIDIDPDMPTTYADYMRAKANLALGEKLKDGAVVFDANADWERTEGNEGKSTMAGGFESTDTPDFFDEDDPRSKIEFTEGMMGSKPKKVHTHDPGVAKALEVNPDIIAGITIDGNRRVEFIRPAARWPGDPAAELSAEFELGKVSRIGTGFEFDIEPVCMGFEDFYAGFTSESDKGFTCEPTFGRMDRKNGDPVVMKVSFKPTGPARSVEATLCVVLPDDGEQWTFNFKANTMGDN
ncbi:hypothetical protein T492DRAFT_1042150 [Pavlovales sp. CCMP2436]|nr:hypothetical protein T492DRAFT_1042150 [Pavlovales sp. CCMP2436]